LAESDTLFKPSFKGAKTILERASPMAFLLPATGSIKAEIGACTIEVAIPSFHL
jgi:hypothetical protein